MREQNAMYKMMNPVNNNGKGVPKLEKRHPGATPVAQESAKSVMESMYEQKKSAAPSGGMPSPSNGVSQIMQAEGTPVRGNGDIPPPKNIAPAAGKSSSSKSDIVPPPMMLLQESMRQQNTNQVQNPRFRMNARMPKRSAYRKNRGIKGILSKIRKQQWGYHEVSPLKMSQQNMPTVLLQEGSNNALPPSPKDHKFSPEDYGYGPANGREVRGAAGAQQRFQSTGSKLVDQSMYTSNPQVRKELKWEKAQMTEQAADPLENQATEFNQQQGEQQQVRQSRQAPAAAFEQARFKEVRNDNAEVKAKLHRKELENQLLKLELKRAKINQAAEQERANFQDERFRSKYEGLVDDESENANVEGDENAAEVSPTYASFKRKNNAKAKPVLRATSDQDMVLPTAPGLDKKPSSTYDAPTYDNSHPLVKDKGEKAVLSARENSQHKSKAKSNGSHAAKFRFMQRMGALHKAQKKKAHVIKWHSWVSAAKAATKARYPVVERS
jgi:hypothetical protein